MKRPSFLVVSILTCALAAACSGSDSSNKTRSRDSGAGDVGAGGEASGSGGRSSGSSGAGAGGEGDATGGNESGTGGTSDGTGGAPPPVEDASTDRADAGFDAADSSQDSGGPDASADSGSSDSGDARAVEVVSVDFEADGGLSPNIDVGTGTLTPSQGYEPLGHPGNTFGPTFLRSLTGNTITVTLTDLPPHSSISIDFLFAAIDSLDGEGTFPAGDWFRIDLDGTTIFRETFANALPDQIQTYVPPVPEIVLARHVDLGFSGPGSYYTDSAYDMSLDPTFDFLPHTASTAVIVFTLEGEGVQDINDESWAIDNLRVTTHE